MTTRKAPPPIRVAGRQARTTTAPAFGKIPTFSHRLPVRKPRSSSLAANSHRRDDVELDEPESCESSDVDTQLAAVAAAQVRNRAIARLRAQDPPSVAVDVQPPTPDTTAMPPAQARPKNPTSLRTLKQDHRAASIYSMSSSVGVIRPPVQAQARQRVSVYLRPDLSGQSGLSLDQLAATSLEDLAEGLRSAASSSSRACDAAHWSCSVQMHAVPSNSSLGPPPSVDYPAHLLPPTGAHALSTQEQVLPPYPSIPRSHDHEQSRRETPSERLKRLYLCPWEAISPRAARVQMQAPLEQSEKALPLDCGVDRGPAASGSAVLTRRRFVVAGAALLALLVLVDLIVLNVRVFSMRDAYYDE